MGRINLYVSKELEPVYEKAKEFAGDSMSSLFGEFLKNYVVDKECELNGMQEIKLFLGFEDYGLNTSSLTGIKFIGTFLAGCNTRNFEDNDDAELKVYLTKKGQLLVWFNLGRCSVRTMDKRLHPNLNDFLSSNYPPELVDSVLKNMPEIQYEVLDI